MSDRFVVGLYCRSFAKGDPRVSTVLSLIESTTGAELTHYVPAGGWPRKIPRDRTQFVNESLPRAGDDTRPRILCTRIREDRWMSVTLSNYAGAPEFHILHKDPCAGGIEICTGGASAFVEPLIRSLRQLVIAGESFHGFLQPPLIAHQLVHTRQALARRLAAAEGLRSEGEAAVEGAKKRLLARAHEFLYDLDPQPVWGVTPDGRPFDAGLFWINYWNEATAARFGFPDPERDRPLQGLYERLPEGWLVKLTAAAPDIEKPEDRQQLQWAFERFGSPGARDPAPVRAQ